MRFVIMLLLAFGLVGAAAVDVPLIGDGLSVVAAQQPSGQIEVDIDTDRGGGTWYASPVWIAIGAIAVIALIAFLVAAMRGGGTTVVKD